jgi:hypothetical protein
MRSDSDTYSSRILDLTAGFGPFQRKLNQPVEQA